MVNRWLVLYASYMAEPKSYPYETHLGVLYDHLQVIDLPEVINAVRHPWFNQTLCRVSIIGTNMTILMNSSTS